MDGERRDPRAVGCSLCVYERESGDDYPGNIIPAPIATVTVNTDNGERQVCTAHALKWEKKS